VNGYAAVYEPDKQLTDSFGDDSVETYVGKVHATDAGADGRPGPRTLCGLDASNLHRLRGDIPSDDFETWYPWDPEVRSVCSRCDELATR
jgi:hypothetical protein